MKHYTVVKAELSLFKCKLYLNNNFNQHKIKQHFPTLSYSKSAQLKQFDKPFLCQLEN